MEITVERTEGNAAKKVKMCLSEGGVYAGVFLLACIVFLALKPLVQLQSKGAVAHALMAVALGACAIVTAYMGITKRLTTRRIIFLLLIVGLILRLGYMAYTPGATRQHDTYTKSLTGHEGYAWTIFETGKLPTSNSYQFYHPPLNALVQAGFMKITSGIGKVLSGIFGEGFYGYYNYAKPSYIAEDSRYFLYSSCQILSVVYSCVVAVTSVKILSLFPIKGKLKLFLYAFVILYPRNIQFAGMLNNDAIAYMLSTLALYYALKWWKGKRSLVWILLCGFTVGLGMMAKLSSATVCLPIGGIFVYEFIARLRKKEGAMPLWKMVVQYGAFLLVCAPIGLWYQLYVKIRFNQGFGFVWVPTNTGLYTGDYSLFERFVFPFDVSEFFGSLYCRSIEGNYWLFNYALRSSIFGEWWYAQGDGFATAAVVFAYMGAVLLFVSLVWCLITYVRKQREKKLFSEPSPVSHKDLLFVFLLMQSQVVSEIYFYLKMPYGCTMDFRYIMPMILAMALTFGCTHKYLVAEGGKVSVLLSRLLVVVCGVFLAVSALFYCVCV